MRIGLIAPPWVPVPPPGYGGLEAVVDRLARGLTQVGHDVLLAAPANSSCPVALVQGTDEVSPDAAITCDTITEMAHVVKGYAAMGGMDVIHDHTVGGPLYRHRPAGVPVVTTNHGPFEPRANSLFRCMQGDTAIVAISRHQASTAEGVGVTRVIHHGLDVEQVPCGAGEGGFAAFLGRMCPDKGAREAIEVAREAGIPLKLAAKMREDHEVDYFKSEVEPLLGGDIEYVGEVDEAGKYRLLGSAVAMLNPIQWPEPFGLVMIESLACGTPVVATSAGSVPEIIDDGRTGRIADRRELLARSLLEAAELDRSACREVAATRFSTARMVADHIDLYAELVGRVGTAPSARAASDLPVPERSRAMVKPPDLGMVRPPR
jgi:glycosyltransferase involved in cell wall biosynthesis